MVAGFEVGHCLFPVTRRKAQGRVGPHHLLVLQLGDLGHPCGGSPQDVAFGHRLLEFLDPGVRHLRVTKIEEF